MDEDTELQRPEHHDARRVNDITTDPVNLLLEVWEKPIRNATLVALPDKGE